MEKRFQIGEIADLLQINRSKLRFWEQQGLLQSERQQDNRYRQYRLSDLLRATDIIFYRDLHFSTNEVGQMLQYSAQQLERELEQKQQEIEAELQALQQTKQKIMQRRQYLHEAQRLQQQPDLTGTPDMQQVRLFHHEDSADWQRSLLDQYAFIGVQTDAQSELMHGIEAVEGEQDLIWQRREDRQYVEVLLRYEMQNDLHNNVAQHCRRLQQAGWQTGAIVARFLFSSRNEQGVDYDYYKGWIEVS